MILLFQHSLESEYSLKILSLKKYRLWPLRPPHPLFYLHGSIPTADYLLIHTQQLKFSQVFSPVVVKCDTCHDLSVFFEIIKTAPTPATLIVPEGYSMKTNSVTLRHFFCQNLSSKDSKIAQIKSLTRKGDYI